MSKQKRTPVGLCTDYELFDSGVIKIGRCFPSPIDPWRRGVDIPDYLSLVDHSLTMRRKEYERELAFEEQRLNSLVRQCEEHQLSVIVAFQGRDAAGKTGATKKIISGLDYDWRLVRVIPVGPPTEEELNKAFYQRFFERDRLPGFGHMRVLDRSWAEDVLVVPVMNLAPKKLVRARYPEIRTLEWLLRRNSVLVKIWLDITKDEQKKRFDKREIEKPWKYKESDRIARKHWSGYTKWGNRLFYWTGSEYAPWHIVPADDKLFSRVTCLRVINHAIEQELESPFRFA